MKKLFLIAALFIGVSVLAAERSSSEPPPPPPPPHPLSRSARPDPENSEAFLRWFLQQNYSRFRVESRMPGTEVAQDREDALYILAKEVLRLRKDNEVLRKRLETLERK
ncbi:MAG: hypothetical protein WCV00_03365 [Verrucomicrobiia bacterium]|jgi:hypothetical protein